MLQSIYITVGVIATLAFSIFIILNCLSFAIDILDRFRRPYMKYYTIKNFTDLANAFYLDKKLQYIFNELKDREINDRALNAWDFRDLVEKEFNNSK